MRMKRDFLRRDWNKKSRLGCGRRKLMKWKRAKGRDNKIRAKLKGYPKSPSVGFKKPKAERGLINGKNAIMINNLKDLEKIKTNDVGIISSSIGNKKKIDLAKKIIALNLSILNLDAKKFLEKNEKKPKQIVKGEKK